MASSEPREGRASGRRRVVAPPTSGRTAAQEAQFDGPDSSATAGPDAASRGSGGLSESPRGADAEGTMSERDRWILEQRPPHWS